MNNFSKITLIYLTDKSNYTQNDNKIVKVDKWLYKYLIPLNLELRSRILEKKLTLNFDAS